MCIWRSLLSILHAYRAEEVGAIVRAIGTALVVKGVLTIVTFGIKLPAGIFIPTLG
jgi:chloride channel 3/4/5